jgi:hypothetical protein
MANNRIDAIRIASNCFTGICISPLAEMANSHAAYEVRW